MSSSITELCASGPFSVYFTIGADWNVWRWSGASQDVIFSSNPYIWDSVRSYLRRLSFLFFFFLFFSFSFFCFFSFFSLFSFFSFVSFFSQTVYMLLRGSGRAARHVDIIAFHSWPGIVSYIVEALQQPLHHKAIHLFFRSLHEYCICWTRIVDDRRQLRFSQEHTYCVCIQNTNYICRCATYSFRQILMLSGQFLGCFITGVEYYVSGWSECHKTVTFSHTNTNLALIIIIPMISTIECNIVVLSDYAAEWLIHGLFYYRSWILCEGMIRMSQNIYIFHAIMLNPHSPHINPMPTEAGPIYPRSELLRPHDNSW